MLKEKRLEGRYSPSNFSQGAQVEAHEDLAAFVHTAGDLLKDVELAQVGHDFWLVRNGNEPEYWDKLPREQYIGLEEAALCFSFRGVHIDFDNKLDFTENEDETRLIRDRTLLQTSSNLN